MGGLFAANLLHRAGWQVQVLEKSTTPLTSRGTGIATHAGLMKVMELAGATRHTAGNGFLVTFIEFFAGSSAFGSLSNGQNGDKY